MSRFVRRIAALAPLVDVPPSTKLCAVVVIPCCDEPDLPRTMASLLAARVPGAGVAEVLVVVNDVRDASAEVKAQNAKTLRWLEALGARMRTEEGWRLYAIYLKDQAPKRAGVGVARRTGMDEAARRLLAVGRPHTPIVSLDADTAVEENYLEAICDHFSTRPGCDAVAIEFAHPTEGPLSPALYSAVVDYELHLRYWIGGLRWAGCPWAFQTVGSAFAVRALAYVEQGGMSERQAGEDFYFLHKFSVRGRLEDLVTTTVAPSPRASARTPFGTGVAVAKGLAGDAVRTYGWQTMREIARLGACLPAVADRADAWRELGGVITPWLDGEAFSVVVEEARAQTASSTAMERRLWQWFTPFRAMKFAHAARAAGIANISPMVGAGHLLEALGIPPALDARERLTQLRQHARQRALR